MLSGILSGVRPFSHQAPSVIRWVIPVYKVGNTWKAFTDFPRPELMNIGKWPSKKVDLLMGPSKTTQVEIYPAENGTTGFVSIEDLGGEVLSPKKP